MKLTRIIYCLAAISLIAGCSVFGGRRGAEMESIENCQVTIVGDRPLKEIVMRAAHQKLWVPEAVEDGRVRCTLDLRGHNVVVDVIYADTSFSIRYVSSENMNYDPATGTINPKYNQWVRNLRREIIGQALKR